MSYICQFQYQAQYIVLKQMVLDCCAILSLYGRFLANIEYHDNVPDSKIHGANMGPTWVLSAPDGPMLAPWILLSGVIIVF